MIFRFATLYNFYHHPLVFILRIASLLIIFTLLFLSIVQGGSIRQLMGFLLLYFMIGFFVNAKFRTLEPEKKVQEARLALPAGRQADGQVRDENFYQTFTLPAAAVLLKASEPKAFVEELRKREEVQFVVTRMGVHTDEVTIEPVTSDELAKEAFAIAREAEKPYVTVLDIFAAYLLLTEGKTKLLFKKELKKNDLLTIVAWAQNAFPIERTVDLFKVQPWGAGIGEAMVSGWTLETQKYTQDFTRLALSNPIALVGRDKELALLSESLAKSKRSNVLLIGEPGVGKKAIVSAFAAASFLGETPKELRFLRVLELFSGTLVAGASTSGELEERLSNILSEVGHAGDIVLFTPELQNIAGAGSDALDVTGVLLPHLLEDKIRVVATVTPQNYKIYVEKNSAFAEAFDKIIVEEPSKEEAIPMLLDASLLLEKRHHVVYSYKAVVVAVELSKKYLPGSCLPGKAIALLDEVAARVGMSGQKTIDKNDIVLLIEAKVPVRISDASKDEKKLLLNLEHELHKRIIDQDEAVASVSEAMRRLRSGLALEGRPVGVFLFLGPTGVGKTETAKALADVYFGNEEHMMQFDMSEYQEQSWADRLIDSLSESVANYPFSLILLDEFEKAYPSILDLFLAVFEDGRLTDSKGRIVSFENTIIIATSNAGSELIREHVLEGVELAKLKPQILDTLQKEGLFKPELINRFDAVVLFEPLGEKEVKQVTMLLLQKLTALFVKKDIAFQFDEKAVGKIAKEGFDQTMGARPLRRFIQDHVEDLLSKKLLRDEIKRGDTVVLSTDTVGNLTLEVR